MPSPFPGMDPYLEGQLWGDFHHEFISGIRASLMPGVRPRYQVLVEERVYVSYPEEPSARVIRPDVSVAEGGVSIRRGGGTAVLEAPLSVPLPVPEETREAYLEVRLAGTHEVVTVIEVLSPGNKRPGSDGQREYLAKRESVLRTGTHLVEIDLLRGGARMPTLVPLPPRDYFIFVSRVQRRPYADVWPLTVRDPLPTIPIPLAPGDPDVELDIQAAFNAVYDRAGYDYLLDYRHEVIPPLGETDAEWARPILGARQGL